MVPQIDKTICEGSSTLLQFTSNATQYSWSPAAGLSNTTMNNLTIDNTANVTLTANILANGVITFINGKFNTTSSFKITLRKRMRDLFAAFAPVPRIFSFVFVMILLVQIHGFIGAGEGPFKCFHISSGGRAEGKPKF